MAEMGIETTIFQYILSGAKTVEGRLRTPKFVTLRKGDLINFREDVWQDNRLVSSLPERAQAIITQTKFFDSFELMFDTIDYRLAIPYANGKQEAIDLYRQFYTPQQEAEHGVVAIEFTVITT